MYETADGEVIYSNIAEAPPKSSRKIRCFKEKKQPAASSEQTQAKSRKKTGSNFPSIDRDTQRKRDDERHTILEQELAAEQKRLDAARQQMEEQQSVRLSTERDYQRYLDRVQPFRDSVANHQRNIQAIQSELNNLR